MKGVGFEKQPYLVYQHRDAGHQHIHIVSTNIQRDGSKIDMNNIGRNQSEAARKSIEIKFELTKAEGRKQTQESPLRVSAQKVQYGKTQTKRAITNVLDVVIEQYKYTSLPELNAILKQYNVMADRGKEDTKMFEKRGLVYTALDDKGNKIGTPIKASDFYSKPTLKYLEQKFVQNEPLKQVYHRKLKVDIQLVMLREKPTLEEFKKALAAKGVDLVLRQSSEGKIYGITYVDYRTKCVFNGSDLGKEFSAKGILEQVRAEQKQEALNQSPSTSNHMRRGAAKCEGEQNHEHGNQSKPLVENLNALEVLFKPEEISNYIPNQLVKKSKRRNPGDCTCRAKKSCKIEEFKL